jgi:hypothetical protein
MARNPYIHSTTNDIYTGFCRAFRNDMKVSVLAVVTVGDYLPPDLWAMDPNNPNALSELHRHYHDLESTCLIAIYDYRCCALGE